MEIKSIMKDVKYILKEREKEEEENKKISKEKHQV